MADQEGSQEPWSLGGCDGIEVAVSNASLLHRRPYGWNCHKAVRSGCEFWNYSAELLVD
jgi:hypothetical protein